MPNKKKSGPGRPKKIFIAKPKIKKSGPGRPKKEVPVYVQPAKKGVEWFIATNILHAPKKDNIILLLFVMSLIIFLFSLYVVVIKGQQTIQKQLVADTNQTVNVQTGNIPFTQSTPQQQSWTTTVVPAAPTNTKSVITTFYDAMNQQDIKTLYALVDSRLKATSVFQTYFSNNRLSLFIGGIQWPIVVSDIQQSDLPAKSTNVQQMKYTLTYSLANGEMYTEQRSATLIEKNGSYKIGKIMCDTQGCSQMPFFNPGKYGIK